MSNVAVIDPRPALTAGARPMAIVPTDMDSAYRLANAVCVAGMAPKGLDTPEKAMVAIMHGLEIGLTPMAALQRIAVVNGRPTIWGDGAIGLVRGSGLCEWIKERIDGDGENRVAVCEAKRRGEPEATVRKFSVADAKQAGLWKKAGPWVQYADRMLQMRARAFALRDLFADVLGGLYIREEIEDHAPAAADAPRAPNVPRIAPPPPPLAAPVDAKPELEAPTQRAAAPPPPPAAADPARAEPAAEPEPNPLDPKMFARDPGHVENVQFFRERAEEASHIDDVEEAWADFIGPLSEISDAGWAMDEANVHYQKAKTRLAKK